MAYAGIARSDLTAGQVRKRLDYSPETGQLTWRERADLPTARQCAVWNGRYAGKPAGHINALRLHHRYTKSYRSIRMNDVLYQAHRLAWLHYYGEWPPDQIDHINGDGLDNRITNLRLATNSENMRNRGRQTNNTTGVTGVIWCRRERKFRAQIKLHGKNIVLGYFDSLDDAAAVRAEATTRYHGEFARAD